MKQLTKYILLTALLTLNVAASGLQGVSDSSVPNWDADCNGWPDCGVKVWYQFTTTRTSDCGTFTTVTTRGGWGEFDNGPLQVSGVIGQDEYTTAPGLWYREHWIMAHYTTEFYTGNWIVPGTNCEWDYVLTPRETRGEP